MRYKTLGFVLLIPAVLIIVAAGVWQLVKSDPTPTTLPTTTVAGNEQRVITTQEVARHNQPSDCWTIIDDNVYNITEYIPRHPGGTEILRACGVEASDLFEKRRTTSGEEIGSGSGHSKNAEDILQKYFIGVIAD